MLLANNLPIRRSKSSPVGTVERNVLPFMGWNWFLRQAVFLPKSCKLINAINSAMNAFQSDLSQKSVRSTTGRLLWICFDCRPMLSVLYRTFQYTQDPSSTNQALLQAVRRELCIMARISSFSYVRICAPTRTRIIAFDACTTGGAVVYIDTDSHWTEQLVRLSVCDDFTTSGAVTQGIVVPSREGCCNRYQILLGFISSHTWKNAFVHHWYRPEHIKVLEARTTVSALDWAVSFKIQGCRVLL